MIHDYLILSDVAIQVCIFQGSNFSSTFENLMNVFWDVRERNPFPLKHQEIFKVFHPVKRFLAHLKVIKTNKISDPWGFKIVDFHGTTDLSHAHDF
jgi:hypothetical protein